MLCYFVAAGDVGNGDGNRLGPNVYSSICAYEMKKQSYAVSHIIDIVIIAQSYC